MTDTDTRLNQEPRDLGAVVQIGGAFYLTFVRVDPEAIEDVTRPWLGFNHAHSWTELKAIAARTGHTLRLLLPGPEVAL